VTDRLPGALPGTLRRVLVVPQTALAALLGAGLTLLSVRLAGEALGGGEGYVDEVRRASLLFSGALVLSLAEPLAVAGEARSGLLTLRRARGGSFGLAGRWLGLWLSTGPALLLSALAGGGWPDGGGHVPVDLAMLAAAGLLLGAWLPRPLLVPALWMLLAAGHLRPWLGELTAGRLLPAFGAARELPADLASLAAPAAFCAGCLLLSHWRLLAVTARAD